MPPVSVRRADGVEPAGGGNHARADPKLRIVVLWIALAVGTVAFIMVFGIVAGALLVWEAWRWPITTAAAPPTVRRERHAVH